MNTSNPPALSPHTNIPIIHPDENDSTEPNNSKATIRVKKKRLRKTVTIELPISVAQRAYDLAIETGKTFMASVVMLAEIGAETPITFVVSPHNPHPDAQVSLKTVEAILAKVSMALRDSKGMLYRLDPDERAATVSACATNLIIGTL